ncbi:hypothetical protein ACFOQM_23595 [Paenibacillus sp. GCM10012307]|uniref:Uncharacterized protein n=1 Tax=Paenibacillus roseus TaxID=2798579 RepID=A0A934MSR4_9BACL|nr:hypothetical protein [Paenibacillus roseus]MBJ6364208.1 hypothetical protein [Paenibacillus roseus]
MDYLLFTGASVFEYVAVFAFMFALFRFRITGRLVVTVLTVSLMMSQVSYFTRSIPQIGEMSAFIQLALYVVVLWVLFQVPFFYSIVMNFAGFAIVVVVQGVVLLAFHFLSAVPADVVKDSVLLGSGVQVLSSLIEIAVAYAIVQLGGGFNFVPTSRRTYTRFNRSNVTILVIILTTVMLAATLAYLFANEFDSYVLSACAVFVVTIPAYLYVALRKEYEDAV